MERFFRYPVIVAGLIGLITVFFVLQLPRTELDNNNYRFLPEKNRTRLDADHIEREFGSSVSILVGLERQYDKVYEKDFRGMVNEDIPVEALEKSREDLVRMIKEELTEDEREFILSVKKAQPVWELLGLEDIEDLPAIQWKLMNLSKMNSSKHKVAVRKLREYLGV